MAKDVGGAHHREPPASRQTLSKAGGGLYSSFGSANRLESGSALDEQRELPATRLLLGLL